VELRLIRRRRWLYEQQTRALCQRYAVLVLEDMDLRQMAATADKPPAVALAEQYRTLAAISEWRQILGRMAPKFGTRIRLAESAYSTRDCWQHGARLPALSGALEETYPCGCVRDIDENAGHVLLRRDQAASGGGADAPSGGAR
jgi:hypothetical protein